MSEVSYCSCKPVPAVCFTTAPSMEAAAEIAESCSSSDSESIGSIENFLGSSIDLGGTGNLAAHAPNVQSRYVLAGPPNGNPVTASVQVIVKRFLCTEVTPEAMPDFTQSMESNAKYLNDGEMVQDFPPGIIIVLEGEINAAMRVSKRMYEAERLLVKGDSWGSIQLLAMMEGIELKQEVEMRSVRPKTLVTYIPSELVLSIQPNFPKMLLIRNVRAFQGLS